MAGNPKPQYSKVDKFPGFPKIAGNLAVLATSIRQSTQETAEQMVAKVDLYLRANARKIVILPADRLQLSNLPLMLFSQFLEGIQVRKEKLEAEQFRPIFEEEAKKFTQNVQTIVQHLEGIRQLVGKLDELTEFNIETEAVKAQVLPQTHDLIRELDRLGAEWIADVRAALVERYGEEVVKEFIEFTPWKVYQGVPDGSIEEKKQFINYLKSLKQTLELYPQESAEYNAVKDFAEQSAFVRYAKLAGQLYGIFLKMQERKAKSIPASFQFSKYPGEKLGQLTQVGAVARQHKGQKLNGFVEEIADQLALVACITGYSLKDAKTFSFDYLLEEFAVLSLMKEREVRAAEHGEPLTSVIAYSEEETPAIKKHYEMAALSTVVGVEGPVLVWNHVEFRNREWADGEFLRGKGDKDEFFNAALRTRLGELGTAREAEEEKKRLVRGGDTRSRSSSGSSSDSGGSGKEEAAKAAAWGALKAMEAFTKEGTVIRYDQKFVLALAIALAAAGIGSPEGAKEKTPPASPTLGREFSLTPCAAPGVM